MVRSIGIIVFTVFILSGCGISDVMYNSKKDSSSKDIQEIIHEKCTYFIGPFNASEHFTIEDTVNEAIEQANEDGFFGDELINVKVEETGYTGILFSEYCVKVEGNLSHSSLK